LGKLLGNRTGSIPFQDRSGAVTKEKPMLRICTLLAVLFVAAQPVVPGKAAAAKLHG
jgi:hypothetical protein